MVPTFSPHNQQDPLLLTVGAAIRRLRLEQGISQEELALRIGLDRTYIGNVERGQSNVALLTLSKIATGLGLTLLGLLREADVK